MSYGAFGTTINIAEGQVMSPHLVDGDTVAHWELNGDTTAAPTSGGGWDLSSGKYLACPILGSALSARAGMTVNASSLVRLNTYNAAMDNTTWTDYSMTLAMCVWMETTSITADLLRFEQYAGGAAKWRWRCSALGAVGMSLDTASGFLTQLSTATIPLKTWTWVAVTMNADGKSGLFRIGDIEESWSLSDPTNVGGSSQSLTPMDAWNTVPGEGCIYSLIMKDISATSEQLDAMFSQTGLRP